MEYNHKMMILSDDDKRKMQFLISQLDTLLMKYKKDIHEEETYNRGVRDSDAVQAGEILG